MRFLVITQVYWPENFRVNDLTSELRARGHEVTVLTGVPNYPEGRVFPEYRQDPSKFAALDGARIVRVPIIVRGTSRSRLALNYLSFALSAALLGAWKLRGCAFDVIFVYQPSPVSVGIPAVLLRMIKRAPVVFWVLDLWPETLKAVDAIRSPRILRAVGALVSFIYERCDLILGQSRSFVPQIEKYCRAAKPIKYFPSWAEQVYATEGIVPAPEVPRLEGGFSVMFAGNIGEAQDFPAILDAAEALKSEPDIRWLIVGDGSAAPWVSAEIRRRGLEDRMLMLGKHPVERMPSFYAHADALLVSLKAEPIFAMTIPGKLQSYLAAGIPILAMLDGEGADLVERSKSGIACSAGDAAGLAGAVRALRSLPVEARQEMGRNARAVSAAEFDRAALISQLERWCAELIQNPGPKSP